ncbi:MULTISPECIES: SDR family oxidoreductase [unclassified Rhizobium]|uniref:SDR family oxidoreductase n=1 Tax=unclassified Rhizobium TaxID=2613769 RepID=UPI0017E90ABD|nr:MULTISPECIES: SDR family oxidoreductase [unclassified Rhizobium]MBB3381722.1 nucleoside-diphosphate-sugar epimerase [Rhizobium sp. BK098]MBB3613424.1 nucleoside-diphosphate-sugar epimerase [Rhizobium sp. BK609]MBB3679082.1 nucleoside-diphosphate-sugar epimerase [Rhizobium sp. BK612]
MSNNKESTKTALVLGATGGIGGAVAQGLALRGWRIRALNRNAAEAARRQPDFDWFQGDAMQADDVLKAAQGADVIVHAVNPPGYRNWGKVVLPMLDNTIAAAEAVGARIVLPGTVYNFGPDVFPIVTEDSAQRPKTRKGAIRVQMERRLRAAAEQGDSPVIIVRAGDFFGGARANSWFSQAMVTPGKPITSMTYPGKRGVGHQWAYLPDVAETMIRLIEKSDELPAFAVYHMRGHWDGDGRQMIEAVQRVVGHKVKVKSFPWWIVPLASPFVTFMRELREMSYLWDVPLEMRNDRLVAVLGEEPHTPIDQAIKESLASIGCLQTA